MKKKFFMGIDIGTFESKGVLIDETADIIATHFCPHMMESPKPGYAEHDAEKTWHSTAHGRSGNRSGFCY